MKAYTDLEQSKKLIKILPIESADMCYLSKDNRGSEFFEEAVVSDGTREDNDIPCWSLAALLDVLQKTAYFIDEDANVVLSSYKTVEWNLGINNSDVELVTELNPVDACYKMILKLHKQKLL